MGAIYFRLLMEVMLRILCWSYTELGVTNVSAYILCLITCILIFLTFLSFFGSGVCVLYSRYLSAANVELPQGKSSQGGVCLHLHWCLWTHCGITTCPALGQRRHWRWPCKRSIPGKLKDRLHSRDTVWLHWRGKNQQGTQRRERLREEEKRERERSSIQVQQQWFAALPVIVNKSAKSNIGQSVTTKIQEPYRLKLWKKLSPKKYVFLLCWNFFCTCDARAGSA